MEHKVFRFFSLGIFIVIIFVSITYNCLTIIHHEFNGKIILKLIPTFTIMSMPIFYYCYYRITIYALLINLALFLCFIGDIFLSLYDPNISELEVVKNAYLFLGGSSFLLARFLILLVMILYPASRVKLISYDLLPLIVSHIIFNVPFIALTFIFFLSKNSSTAIYALIMIYIILGFGLQLSYSFLRIKAISWESIYSSICGFCGVLLFNISDFLLLSTMFTPIFPEYCILISDNIYWLAMFLLSLSIVRSNTTLEEKGIILERI